MAPATIRGDVSQHGGYERKQWHGQTQHLRRKTAMAAASRAKLDLIQALIRSLSHAIIDRWNLEEKMCKTTR